MADTAIEWATKVWNPTTGCDRVSAGCDHCYAMTMAKRLKGMGSAKYQRDGDPKTSGPGFGVSYHSSALGDPLRWTKPQRVFVNSMSDVFHDEVPEVFIQRIWEVMLKCPQHTFMVLTKRHARMRSVLGRPGFYADIETWVGRAMPQPLPNVWLGVSAENQQWANIRIPALLGTPAAMRFVSAEPLLGPIDLTKAIEPNFARGGWKDLSRLHWVITGGESGPGARPMHPDWARGLRDQCQAAGVAFLFKQWGEYRPAAQPGDQIADMTCVQESTGVVAGPKHDGRGLAPGGWVAMRRVGKKSAGRELDGRTWDQYPTEVAA